MTKYLLDTTILIDFMRGQQLIVELLQKLVHEGHQLGISAVNIAELYAGLSLPERENAARLIDHLKYYELHREGAKLAGSFRYSFARQGKTLSVADTLVAATAVINEAVLITANIKDYPMKELRVLQQPRESK